MSDDATSLTHVLRAGETVVWTGRPGLQSSGLTGQQLIVTAFQAVVFAVVAWNIWQTDSVMSGYFITALILAVLGQVAAVPVFTRRRLARTTYYLTDRRAIVADGKTVETIGLGASPFLKYAAGGKRVTATFGPSGPPARFEWAKTPPKGELTFTNVSDVEGLVSALDHLARGSEPKQLRADWDAYETDGSAGNSLQRLPNQPHT